MVEGEIIGSLPAVGVRLSQLHLAVAQIGRRAAVTEVVVPVEPTCDGPA
jgi:hypothetical protein